MINLAEFVQITEEVCSDMALSVLSLLRERMPCSENYWRYRRNYHLHIEKQKPQSLIPQQSIHSSSEQMV